MAHANVPGLLHSIVHRPAPHTPPPPTHPPTHTQRSPPVQAFGLTAQEGAVFRLALAPSAPWKVYAATGGGGWEAVGRMNRRPTQEDIEDVFYNASAASSPLAKGAKLIKGLVGGKKK